MNITFWNCLGAGSEDFRRALIDLIHSADPSILIFAETRVHCSHMKAFLRNKKFDKIVCSEVCGFAGGLWILWNLLEVTLYPVILDFQMIT